MGFMTAGAERAFGDAIAAIERVSAAEIVVAVRPRLRRWLGAHVAMGALWMLAVLAFALWSEHEFDLWSILVLPAIAALAGGLAVDALAPLERLLVPASIREGIALEAARAAFVELGVHGTVERTGILVLVAVRERRVVLVGDRGAVERLGDAGLARLAGRLAVHLPAGGVEVAHALAAMADELATALPRSAADTNELPDLVQARRPVARRFRGAAR